MTSFRDLWIWQESHKLMLEIHQFAKSLPREERFRKRDQIERSSSSVPDNIAEGYTAYYYNEKIKGMLIARREAGETQNHVEALFGKQYLPRSRADAWINRYERIMAGINSYVNYVNEKRDNDSRKGKGKGYPVNRRSGTRLSGDLEIRDVPDLRISGSSSPGYPDSRIS